MSCNTQWRLACSLTEPITSAFGEGANDIYSFIKEYIPLEIVFIAKIYQLGKVRNTEILTRFILKLGKLRTSTHIPEEPRPTYRSIVIPHFNQLVGLLDYTYIQEMLPSHLWRNRLLYTIAISKITYNLYHINMESYRFASRKVHIRRNHMNYCCCLFFKTSYLCWITCAKIFRQSMFFSNYEKSNKSVILVIICCRLDFNNHMHRNIFQLIY